MQQHEKLSALHKENQAKKAAAEAKSATSPKQETIAEASYRDRTKERRLLYGDFAPHAASGNSSHADAFLAQVNNDMGEVKATEAIRPEETLGTSNVGNKLLQKLGWKSGDTLGRKQDEHGPQSNKGNGGVANSLKSDWERIESLAQGGGRAR